MKRKEKPGDVIKNGFFHDDGGRIFEREISMKKNGLGENPIDNILNLRKELKLSVLIESFSLKKNSFQNALITKKGILQYYKKVPSFAEWVLRYTYLMK